MLKTKEIGSYTRLYWRSGISSTRVRNSTSFHSFRYAPLVKRRNFSHSWKKSQIFNRDSCKNLLVCSSSINLRFLIIPLAFSHFSYKQNEIVSKQCTFDWTPVKLMVNKIIFKFGFFVLWRGESVNDEKKRKSSIQYGNILIF